MGKTEDQLDAEIAASIASAKPKRTRKAKAKAAPETARQRLERELLDEDARLRSTYRGGATAAQISEQRGRQLGARGALARQLAIDLGHYPLKQGISYECSRCGASGTFDVAPIGTIFTERCT